MGTATLDNAEVEVLWAMTKAVELLYSVVKEHKRRKSSFLYIALEKSKSVTNIQNFFLFLYHIGKESVILLSC